MTREADRVHLRIDDVRVARGTPVKARVDVRLVDPPVGDSHGIALGSERHRWRCHAPRTRVDLSVESLGLAFSGSGYHDENWGDEPPVTSLRSWSWGRVHDGSRSRVFFDVVPHHGPRTHLVFDSRSGRHEETRPPLTLRRSPFRWMLAEPKTMDAGPGDDGAPIIVRASRSLERAPFYHRFQAPFRFARQAPPVTGVAEHVDFVRFARPVVRGMIGYRLAEPDRGWFGKIP